MPNTFAAPKPTPRIKTPKAKRIKSKPYYELKTLGTVGQDQALWNCFNEALGLGLIEDFSAEKACPRGDGRISRTYRITLSEATFYEPKGEVKFIERPGYVYCSVTEEPDIYKIGESISLHRRIGELQKTFDDDNMEMVAAFHCRDRFARETYVHNELKKIKGCWQGGEKFRLNDGLLDWFRGLPNED